MKKFLIMLLAGITLCMSACQQTPEEPVVISKNDGKLKSIIYGEPAPLGKYSAPEKWEETIEDNNSILTVKMNADISIPDVEAFPVYRVTPEVITDEKANDFITACIGDEKIYSVDNYRTKQLIMDEILKLQNDIDDPNSLFNYLIELEKDEPDFDEIYEESIKEVQEQIAMRQNEYKNAPDEVQMTEAERKFVFREAASPIRDVWYEMSGATHDLEKYVFVQRDEDIRGGYGLGIKQKMIYNMRYKKRNFLGDSILKVETSHKHNLRGMKYSYEEAKALADECIHNKFGYKNYDVNFVGSAYHLPDGYTDEEWLLMGKQRIDLDEDYIFIYTPRIAGIPITYYNNKNYKVFSGKEDVAPIVWNQHNILVSIDNDGISSVCVRSSLDINEELNSNVKLLPFDEIKKILKKQIFFNANYNITYETLEGDNPSKIELNIDNIQLGYVKLREQDGLTTEGMLIPVWCFFGLQRNIYEKQENSPYYLLDENSSVTYPGDVAMPFLCINAIDGSIIDLSKGY